MNDLIFYEMSYTSSSQNENILSLKGPVGQYTGISHGGFIQGRLRIGIIDTLDPNLTLKAMAFIIKITYLPMKIT